MLVNGIQSYVPSREQVVERFSPSWAQVSRNINKYAVPVIVLLAFSSLPVAEAGFGLALLGYVATNVVGGAMIIVGAAAAPIGGAALMAAGVATVAAAPYTLVVTLPAPTP